MRIAITVACLSIAGLSAAADALAALAQPTNIPPQRLSAALQALARDRNLQLVYAAAEVDSLRTSGAVGELTAAEALTRLLSGTGLTYRYLDENTITVLPIVNFTASQAMPLGGAPQMQSTTFWGRLRLAQATPDPAPVPQAERTAQPAPHNMELEEVVVDARRHLEDLQKVPISIAALSGAELDTYHLGMSSELQNYVPNLTINGAFNSTNPQIFIRGVGNNDYNDNAGATVGVYLDGVFLNAPAGKLLQMFDLDSAQVLRGPQGTLFGKNNTAGAILFSSVKPGRDVDGSASFTVGNYGSRDVEAALTLPLSETWSSRVALNTRNASGWGKTHEASDRLAAKTGALDEYAGRLLLRWQPSGSTDALLNLSHSETDDDRLPARAFGAAPDSSDNAGWINPDDDVRVNYSNYKEVERVKTTGAFLTVNHDFGSLALTSISAFWKAQRFVSLDVDKSPFNSLHITRHPDSDQYSQELRLASSEQSAFRWVAGALFFKQPLEVENFFSFSGTADPRDAGIPQTYHNDARTKAVFAETIVDLNPAFSLTVGARYSIDQNDFGMNFPFVAIDHITRSREDKNVSGRVILSQNLSEDFSLYYSISTGFQGGGFNGGAFGIADIGGGYEPEKLTAYEIGWKSEPFDRRMKFNGALFYYDYRDIQLFSLAATSSGAFSQTIANTRAGRAYGLDLDVKALVTERMTVSGGVGLLSTRYEDASLGLFGYGGTFFPGDGNTFISAPKVDFKSSADYLLPLDAWQLRLHADYSYRSKRAFDLTSRPQVSGGAYGILNLKATAGPSNRNWDVSLWAKNLFDKEYVSFVADLSGSVGLYETFYGAPRQYGLQVAIRY